MNMLTRYSPFRSLWDPADELEDMEKRMNRLIRRSSQDIQTEDSGLRQWSPSVDISEDDKEFLVKAELPDVKKEDVKVSVEEGVLQITGERKLEKEEKGKKFHRIERAYGSFARSFTLPEGADPGRISADYKDGILNVHIAKSDKAKAKSVDVKIS